MKRKSGALLIGLLILNLTILGQDFIIFSTKDIIKISEKFGFDSVFSIVGNWSIYDLDSQAALEIAQNTQNQTSKYIDYYLINYAQRNKQDSLILPILLNHFEKELLKIQDYKPNYNWELPMINKNLIHVFQNFSSDKAEEFLIKYYREWYKKSLEYETAFLKGKETNKVSDKYKLMAPFESCNFNCYLILLGLQKFNSSYSDNSKLDFHRNNLCESRQSVFSLNPDNLTNYKPTKKDKIITLSINYKTIGDIDFNSEPELKKEFKEFAESYLGTDESEVLERCCFQKVLYNGNSGYLQYSCSFGPMSGLRILYRIELIEKTLVFYYVYSSIS